MKINISNLSEGSHHYVFTECRDNYDVTPYSLCDDLKIIIDLIKSGSELIFTISINGRIITQCDRCLDNYEFDFDNKFNLIFKHDLRYKKLNEETEENFRFLSPHSHFVDLTDDIRDYILLSVPMRKVPEEKDGKCVYCQKNIEELLTGKYEVK
ncbi:MAG: DUF177 domain-containing protein [Ignavibacteria bacterium]|nr:DUF177 domain-containing protein [Ignavibacteria bacterium]